MFPFLATIIVLLLLSIVSSLLLVPFDVSFKVAGGAPTIVGEVSIRWLGLGLFRRSTTGREVGKAPSSGRTKRTDPIKILRLFKEAIPSFMILFRALRKSVSFRRLCLEVKLGLDDPAETAAFSGYIWIVSRLVNLLPNSSFTFSPNFDKPGLDGSVAADLRMRLLPLVIGFLRAYAKKPFRAFLGEVRG